MTRADRIARLPQVPGLEWRVRAVVKPDLKDLAQGLEEELNSAVEERFHLAMMMERPEKDGIVLVFHRPFPVMEEPGSSELPGPTAN